MREAGIICARIFQDFPDLPENVISIQLSEIIEHHEKQQTPDPAGEDRAFLEFAVWRGTGSCQFTCGRVACVGSSSLPRDPDRLRDFHFAGRDRRLTVLNLLALGHRVQHQFFRKCCHWASRTWPL